MSMYHVLTLILNAIMTGFIVALVYKAWNSFDFKSRDYEIMEENKRLRAIIGQCKRIDTLKITWCINALTALRERLSELVSNKNPVTLELVAHTFDIKNNLENFKKEIDEKYEEIDNNEQK